MPKSNFALPAFGGILQDTTQPGTALEGTRRLPLDLLDPNPAQARQVFDEVALQELVESIRLHGVLEPVLVRPMGVRYQIVAGERRVRASRIAAQPDIPAIIRAMNDTEAALVTALENLQRADLDLEDETRHLAYLQGLSNLSDRALAEQLGKHRNYVNRRLRLLRERPALFAAIRAGTLTHQAALELLDTPAEVSHDGTRLLEDSNETAPDPPPVLVERAALDRPRHAAPTLDSRIPYRARALDSAATTLLRLDWQTVPPGERATVLEQIMLLKAALTNAEAALAAEED